MNGNVEAGQAGTLKTIDEIAAVIAQDHEVVDYSPSTVTFVVIGEKKPIHAVLAISDATARITCQIAGMESVAPEDYTAIMAVCLNANQVICPYAFSLLQMTETPQLLSDFTLVLIDSLPLIDLSPEELCASIDSLLQALHLGREMIGDFFPSKEEE